MIMMAQLLTPIASLCLLLLCFVTMSALGLQVTYRRYSEENVNKMYHRSHDFDGGITRDLLIRVEQIFVILFSYKESVTLHVSIYGWWNSV